MMISTNLLIILAINSHSLHYDPPWCVICVPEVAFPESRDKALDSPGPLREYVRAAAKTVLRWECANCLINRVAYFCTIIHSSNVLSEAC